MKKEVDRRESYCSRASAKVLPLFVSLPCKLEGPNYFQAANTHTMRLSELNSHNCSLPYGLNCAPKKKLEQEAELKLLINTVILSLSGLSEQIYL